jgi:hypothetical protein
MALLSAISICLFCNSVRDQRLESRLFSYRWDLAIGKGAVDAVQLEFIGYVLFLEFDVRGAIDRHVGGKQRIKAT